MTETTKCRRFRARYSWPWGSLSCLGLDSTCRIPLKGSLILPICRKQSSFGAAATSRIAPVPTAASRVFGKRSTRVCCMMWVTSCWGVPGTSIWSIRNTVVPGARSSSTRTLPSTPCLDPTIRIASFPWRCDSSWRMGYPIKPRVGTCGATIAYSCPSPPSRTGWRSGGKGGPTDVDELSGLGPG